MRFQSIAIFQNVLTYFLYFTSSSNNLTIFPKYSHLFCFSEYFSLLNSRTIFKKLGFSSCFVRNLFYFPKIFHSLFFSKHNSLFFEPFRVFFVDSCFFFKFSEFSLVQTLVDCTVSDYLVKTRFVIFYNFLSILRAQRFFIRLPLCAQSYLTQSSIIPVISDSLVNLYESSLWLERETWDMFGIFFLNNPDLRRILTDYGFRGFPLRKDFPVVGFLEIFFNFSTQHLTYTSIELVQNFRLFLHETPWVPNYSF